MCLFCDQALWISTYLGVEAEIPVQSTLWHPDTYRYGLRLGLGGLRIQGLWFRFCGLGSGMAGREWQLDSQNEAPNPKP